MKCKCGKPVETRPGLEYPLCYDCWWAQDPRNEAKPALPPASLGDEERASAYADTVVAEWPDRFMPSMSQGNLDLIAHKAFLAGLRTSRAELLAEREKVRCLSVAVEKARFLSLKPHRKITEQSGIFTILDQVLKETE